MPFNGRFVAILRALRIRNYRIDTSGNRVSHSCLWAYRKPERLAQALETMPTRKGTS